MTRIASHFQLGHLILNTLGHQPSQPHAAYLRVRKVRTDRAQNTSITQQGVNFLLPFAAVVKEPENLKSRCLRSTVGKTIHKR
jgi:hypothetical protein